ncbi:MAG: hypothetical protein IPK10_17325 [Bacteroidetes bacterium]|nr:hypothetical protein [Bacteroidota bacterium]
MFKKIASYLFLLLFLQVIVPASLWHALCDHEDSTDCYVASSGLTITEKHQHCSVLDLTLPAIFHQDNVFSLKPIIFVYSQVFFFKDSCCQHPIFKSDGRGPPQIV